MRLLNLVEGPLVTRGAPNAGGDIELASTENRRWSVVSVLVSPPLPPLLLSGRFDVKNGHFTCVSNDAPSGRVHESAK